MSRWWARCTWCELTRGRLASPGKDGLGEGAYDELSTASLPLIVQAAITARGGGFLQSEVGEEGVSSLR